MKKFLLLFLPFLTLLCIKNPAQVMITKQDLPGITTFSSHNVKEPIPVPSGGAEQSWNYANVEGLDTLTSKFTAASESPYFSQYADASLVVNFGDSLSEFLNLGKNGLYSEGIYDVKNAAAYIYIPKELLFVAPIEYGQTVPDSARYTYYTTDGGVDYYHILHYIQVNTAIGYGKITTPAGVFANTLLIRQVYYSLDTTQLTVTGPLVQITSDTSVSYAWVQKDPTLPMVFNLQLAKREDLQGTAQYYDKEVVFALSANKKQVPSRRYPVPADKEFTIELIKPQDGVLTLCTLEGRQILMEPFNYQSKISLNMASLSAGMYLYEIRTSDGGFIQDKIAVIH